VDEYIYHPKVTIIIKGASLIIYEAAINRAKKNTGITAGAFLYIR